jgi:hypothetical protein
MIPLLCILLGLALGQHLKITISPEFQAFITRSWSSVEIKALPIAKTAAKQLKQAATKSLKSNQSKLEGAA